MIKRIFDALDGFLSKKVTPFQIPLDLLLDFIFLFIMVICLATGAKVDAWLMLIITLDIIWSYLDEKRRDKAKLSKQ